MKYLIPELPEEQFIFEKYFPGIIENEMTVSRKLTEEDEPWGVCLSPWWSHKNFYNKKGEIKTEIKKVYRKHAVGFTTKPVPAKENTVGVLWRFKDGVECWQHMNIRRFNNLFKK